MCIVSSCPGGTDPHRLHQAAHTLNATAGVTGLEDASATCYCMLECTPMQHPRVILLLSGHIALPRNGWGIWSCHASAARLDATRGTNRFP